VVTKRDIEQAYQRIRQGIIQTPTLFSPVLSNMVQAQVYLKLENLQRTGSFKDRGAFSYLSGQKTLPTHVVAASAGNHAQAVAMFASELKINATIFMPVATPIVKVKATEKLQARVRLVGQSYDEAFAAAFAFASESGAHYLHAYDDPFVIAGQGTVALEICEQIGQPDVMLVPVGGGGLLSGIATYMEGAKPSKTQFFGVEAADFQSMAQALHKGRPVSVSPNKTVADGIAIKKVGLLPFEICAGFNPTMVSVTDDEIQNSIMLLLEKQKLVVEGAGAVGVAALLSLDNACIKGKSVVVVISGGNIDISFLSRLTGQELIKSRRLGRMSLVIKDTPGSLAALLNNITTANGNIVEVRHERCFAQLRWNEVMVEITVETKDEAHEKLMTESLVSAGFTICSHAFGAGNG
jgi:threonine dehydratase